MRGMTDDRAWGRLRAHRHYPYRGCAPHWDDPQMCAGDEELPRSVFYGPADGNGQAEGQKDRLARETAAAALCARCPIRDACRAYAVGDGQRVREPHGIWAGTTPATRRREVKHRLATQAASGEPTPLPVAEMRTQQKQDVLAALALHEDLEKVVYECEQTNTRLDDRCVRWHISRLHTLLRIPPEDQDREHLLAAARAAGVLPEIQPLDLTDLTPDALAQVIPFTAPSPARVPEGVAA